jgi:hypothetical protein
MCERVSVLVNVACVAEVVVIQVVEVMAQILGYSS